MICPTLRRRFQRFTPAVAVCLALMSTCMFSQSADIRFKHLRIEDGLSQSSVHAIAQDRIGFLWFGTEDGLNRYDGYTFTVYRHDPLDSFSISDNYITRLLTGRNGDLWIGTFNGGLNRYEVATLVNEEMQPGSYEVAWDPRGMSSGVYFYRLQTSNSADTKKLLLLR
jgi:ligand-binding sensor domain-containing protein